MSEFWQSLTNEKEKYAAYLCSRQWAEIRQQVLDRCNGICERCGVNTADAVHHLTYVRKYHERLADLQAICNFCHEFIHGKSEWDPKPIQIPIKQPHWEPYTPKLDDGFHSAEIVNSQIIVHKGRKKLLLILCIESVSDAAEFVLDLWATDPSISDFERLNLSLICRSVDVLCPKDSSDLHHKRMMIEVCNCKGKSTILGFSRHFG